jgi:hypothetical protein
MVSHNNEEGIFKSTEIAHSLQMCHQILVCLLCQNDDIGKAKVYPLTDLNSINVVVREIGMVQQ